MTVNSNASPVAFAILFGNKNTSTWGQFWKYCLELHPCIDSGKIKNHHRPGQGPEKCNFRVSLIGGAFSLFVSSSPEYYQDVRRRWWESSQLSALDVQ